MAPAYPDEVQPHWQEAVDSNLDKTNQIIQALSRSEFDRSTTFSFSFDMFFDIYTTKTPSSTLPCPIIFIMSQSLANLLSTHCQLPLHCAFRLSTSCQQMLHFYQIVIYPCDKGKSKAFSSYHSGEVRSIPPTLYSHDSSMNLSSSYHSSTHTSSWTRSTPRCSSFSCLFGFTTEGKSSTTPLSDIGLYSISS